MQLLSSELNLTQIAEANQLQNPVRILQVKNSYHLLAVPSKTNPALCVFLIPLGFCRRCATLYLPLKGAVCTA